LFTIVHLALLGQSCFADNALFPGARAEGLVLSALVLAVCGKSTSVSFQAPMVLIGERNPAQISSAGGQPSKSARQAG
jgi:hypothetical protein